MSNAPKPEGAVAGERQSELRLIRLAQFSTDRAADAVLWIQPSGAIIYANDTACRMLGYTRETLVGRTIPEIDPNFPADSWDAHWAELKACRTLTFESDYWTKDGRLIRTEVTANFVLHEGEEYNCATVRDVTARRQTEEQLHRQLARLAILSTLTETLNASSALEEMYEATLAGFQRALDVKRMAILIRDADGVTRFKAWRGVSATYRMAVEGHSFWTQNDPHPKIVAIANIAEDPAAGQFRTVALAEGIRALVAVPLVVKGRTIGKCMLYFDAPRRLSAGERRLAQTIAGHVAFAVERKLAEAEVWASNDLLQTIIESTPDAVFAKDRRGRYLLMNSAAGRFVDKRPVEVIGLTDEDLFPAAEAQALIEDDRRIMTSRDTRTFEEEATAADGLRRTLLTTKGPLFDERGEVRGVVGIARDTTEYKNAQEQVRRSEAWFRSLLQNSSDITTVLDKDGTIRYESPAFYRLFGWKEQELIGRNAFDLVHPDDRERVMHSFAVRLQSSRRVAPIEFGFMKADGGYLRVEAIGHNRLDDPDIAGIIVNSRDITERHRLEDRLRQAEKMEAIGRLAGGIAHDFNNLLMVIEGCTESAQSRDDLPAGMGQQLEEIRQAGHRAARLTGQLLTFSRQRPFVPAPVDLNATVQDITGMLRRLIGSTIRLETRLSPGAGFIKVDLGQLEQVVMNLALNARDSMARGGTLTVETSNSSDKWAVLSVRDQGCGMDPATKARIFEPFFTTKEPGQGTGLGLATVYAIVARHGGRIEVESEPGRGTAVTISFPRLEATGPLVAHRRARNAAEAETVLLVEDEGMVRTHVRDVLSRQGYRVLEAPSGDAALASYGSQGEAIDLLLTDLVMPGINGRTLAERMTGTYPTMKVLFMSGFNSDAEARGEQWREVPFLQKPFSADLLVRVVRQALDSSNSRPH